MRDQMWMAKAGLSNGGSEMSESVSVGPIASLQPLYGLVEAWRKKAQAHRSYQYDPRGDIGPHEHMVRATALNARAAELMAVLADVQELLSAEVTRLRAELAQRQQETETMRRTAQQWAIYCFSRHGDDSHLYNGLADLGGVNDDGVGWLPRDAERGGDA